MKYYIGIDLGGTNIAAGVVDENFNIIAKNNVKTGGERSADNIVLDIATAARQSVDKAGLSMADITCVGIGCPGSTDPYNGILMTATNIPFSNYPLSERLSELLGGMTVYTDNDANAAAYGEQLAGAGRGTKNFVVITLGTGVGGGIITDGKMTLGVNCASGEIGHEVIDLHGESCPCGRRGCYEMYASVTALIRQTKKAMQANTESKMWSLVESIDGVNGKTAFDGMRLGDDVAKEVVEQYCEYVSVGVTNVINLLQPDTVCIGGGISKEGDTLLAPIKAYVEKYRYSQNEKVQTIIKAAELGNDAGIIGAAMLFKLYSKES